jgi:hypothetical protein
MQPHPLFLANLSRRLMEQSVRLALLGAQTRANRSSTPSSIFLKKGRSRETVDVLQGVAAFSPFRIEALAGKLRTVLNADGAGASRHGSSHFLDVQQPLDAESLARACSLLGADSACDVHGGFFVTPSQGHDLAVGHRKPPTSFETAV